MEINKQLFEDVLSGKLKGTFVLRNTYRVSSNELKLSNNLNTNYPYYLNNGSYTNCGRFNIKYPGTLDIIDFIPDTNMKETKELQIQIPEGFEIDEEKSTFEKIVFKKKDIKPRSWEEYCRNFKGELFFEIFDDNGTIDSVVINNGRSTLAKSYLPSKELLEASLAMMQLMSVRQAWIDDWEPDWLSENSIKYCIDVYSGKIDIDSRIHVQCSLSFPTKEMAEDFLNCFKDLLEIAKPLV